MSTIERMYAVPSSPFSFSPEELARMRRDVAHAEAEAQRATSWGERTRWEQEAKSLRGLIRGGEIERQVEAAHEAVNRARPRPTFQAAIERGVAAGRYAPVKPHYAEQATASPRAPEAAPTIPSETELMKLQALATTLQAILDDPAADAQLRTKAQLALTPIRLRIGEIEAALNPVTAIGQPATAGNVSIADVTKAVNALVAKAKPKRMCVGNKAELLT